MTPSPVILDVQHLTMRFGGLVAVDDLSFQAKRGEITAIIGPNGAGKTTVFNCITGFYQPTEGMIRVIHPDGKEFLLERLFDFRIAELARVARTFQNIRLFPAMTVLENLLVAQHNELMNKSGYTLFGLFGLPIYRQAERAAVEKARHWLDKIGLLARADDSAGELPYGIVAGIGTSLLLIEHHMHLVMDVSHRVIVLDYGQKIAEGTPGEVSNNPAVIAAYLGVDEEEIEVVMEDTR